MFEYSIGLCLDHSILLARKLLPRGVGGVIWVCSSSVKSHEECSIEPMVYEYKFSVLYCTPR